MSVICVLQGLLYSHASPLANNAMGAMEAHHVRQGEGLVRVVVIRVAHRSLHMRASFTFLTWLRCQTS